MSQPKYGVLLANLGTPQAQTAKAVKRFLREFLHDHRVIDLSRWAWCPILHGIILPIRSPKVAKLYQSVWMDGGSPLMVYSRRQQMALSEALNVPVEIGMTYDEPSISEALDKLQAQGCKKVVVLPLYPQYSATTTAAVFDQVARACKTRSYVPEIRMVHDYYQEADFIAALANSVKAHWAEHGKPDYLLCSYHGIPQRYADNGDPYPQQCQRTTELLADALDMPREKMSMSFQSIFGKEEWVKPYTDKTIEALAEKGVSRLDVICPAFSSDCLETLEEIAVQGKESFIESGGKELNLIPCLNDRQDHIDMMIRLVNQQAYDWLLKN
jgi:ferrochelatase